MPVNELGSMELDEGCTADVSVIGLGSMDLDGLPTADVSVNGLGSIDLDSGLEVTESDICHRGDVVVSGLDSTDLETPESSAWFLEDCDAERSENKAQVERHIQQADTFNKPIPPTNR